jgi:hypothetical protein
MERDGRDDRGRLSAWRAVREESSGPRGAEPAGLSGVDPDGISGGLEHVKAPLCLAGLAGGQLQDIFHICLTVEVEDGSGAACCCQHVLSEGGGERGDNVDFVDDLGDRG